MAQPYKRYNNHHKLNRSDSLKAPERVLLGLHRDVPLPYMSRHDHGDLEPARQGTLTWTPLQLPERQRRASGSGCLSSLLAGSPSPVSHRTSSSGAVHSHFIWHHTQLQSAQPRRCIWPSHISHQSTQSRQRRHHAHGENPPGSTFPP